MRERVRPLGVVLAVLVVALGAVAVLQVRDRIAAEDAAPPTTPVDVGQTDAEESPDPDDVAATAVLAGRRAVSAYFSLDHRTLGADLAGFLRLTTPDYGAEYATATRTLRRRVLDRRLVLRPVLPPDGTATEWVTTEAARVLVVVDVATTVGAGPTDRETYRTRVDLVRDEGRWLVAALDRVT